MPNDNRVPMYNPLLNARYQGGQLVDNLTNIPVNNPLLKDFVPQTPVADPLRAAPAAPAAPAGQPPAQPSVIDVGAFEKASDLYKQSSVRQRELFDEYSTKLYGEYRQANPRATMSQDRFAQQLAAGLSKDSKNYISIDPATGQRREPETDLLRDTVGTAVGAVTGLVDAGAGLLNAGVSTVVGKNALTAGIAEGAHMLHKTANKINSVARQDFDQQVQEVMSDDKKDIGDLVGLYMDNKWYGTLDLVGMVGTGWGAGALAKGVMKGAAAATAATTARGIAATGAAELGVGAAGQAAVGQTAATASRLAAPVQNAEHLAKAANIIGQTALGAGQGAQAMGERNGDFQLTRLQGVGAGIDGVIAGLATHIGMKYGYTPESILLGATPAKVSKEALPSLLRTTMQSLGVEASTNAVQAAADAMIVTGFDKDGNLDLSKIDWNQVEQAGLIGGGVGGLMGGVAGYVGGARSRSATKAAQKAAKSETLNDNVIDGEQPAPPTHAERAGNDDIYVDPVNETPTRNTNVADAMGDPLAQVDPQMAFMDSPTAQDFFSRFAREPQAEQAASPAASADPLRLPAPERPRLEGPRAADAEPGVISMSDALREYYDKTPAHLRDGLPAQLNERLQTVEGSPAVIEARQRELLRHEPGYVEMNPEQVQADTHLLGMLSAARQAYTDMQNYHLLQTNNGLVYDATAPHGRMAQDAIDERVAREMTGMREVPTGTKAARTKAQTDRQLPTQTQEGMATPQQVVMARDMLRQFRDTPNHQKAQFMEDMNRSYMDWFTKPFDQTDGRTFDQLQFDAQNAPDVAQRTQAQRLLAQAQGEADTRTRLKGLMDAENKAFMRDYEAQQLAYARELDNVTPDTLNGFAAEMLLKAADGKAIRAAKIAGVSALKADRAASPAASELARSHPTPDRIRKQLDADYLGEQRGSTALARTAQRITGVPSAPLLDNVLAVRQQNPVAYAKQTLVYNLANYEAVPGGSGRTRIHTSQYLNYLQGKQDAITQAIGEWRPMSLEDVRLIAGDAIPELRDIGIRKKLSPADNTRRYVNRIINSKISEGDITPETAPALRLLRDWMIADVSESTYATQIEARAGNADIPSIRQLRQVLDGDLLPSGKAGTGDVLNNPVPEMRPLIEQGDISGALGRAIASLPSSRASVLRALKNVFDKIVDPVRVRISDEPLRVGDREVPAYYDKANAEIVVDTRYADRPDIIGHEALHAATQDYLDRGGKNRLTGTRRSAYEALNVLWHEATERPGMPENGMKSLHEFVADAMSNPEMQDFLKGYESKHDKLGRMRSMYKSFIGAVRKMVGLPPKSYSALEDVVGLTHLMVAGAPANGSHARLVESSGFQSGTLHRYEHDGKTSVSNEFGTMKRMEDGAFRIETDDSSVYGATVHDFDTYSDAARFAADEFGAEIRSLSDREEASRSGLLHKNDVYNPVVSKLATAIENALGQYLPEGVQQYINPVVQTILTGGRWAMMQTDRLEILNQLDRAMASIGYKTNLHGKFEDARRFQRAQMRPGADLPSLLHDINTMLAPVKKTSADLGQFMQAMHVPERNKMHSYKGKDVTGFTWGTGADGKPLVGDAAANAYLASLDPEIRQVFHETSKKVWKQWQTVLKEENRSGILSDEQYRRMGGVDENGVRQDGAYEFYVPLLNEEDMTGWLTPKQGVSGRTTEAANPFAALIIQLQQRMSRVYRNDAMRELGATLNEHRIPEIADIETYKLRWDKEGKLARIPEHIRSNQNAVYWQEGGAIKVMHMNTKTAEGRAMLKALRSDNMNMNALIRGVGATTRFMAKMNTLLNPAFQLKTLAWDVTSTLLNYQGAYGNGITAGEGARLAMRSVLRAGRSVSEIAKARYAYHSDNAAYNLFGKLGAGMGAGAFLNQSRIDKAVAFNSLASNTHIIESNGLLKGSAKIAAGYGDATLNLLHSADDAIRFAGFVEYIQHKTGQDISTMSAENLTRFASEHADIIDQAVKGSKEINGNFERQGNGGMLHSMYAFWNATMQGTRLFASIASSKQGQYGMMALIAMGAASALHGITQPDDDDGAGGSQYASTRNRKTAILMGDAAVPLIYEGRLPYVLGNSLALYFSGKITAGRLMGDLLHTTGDLFIPFMPMDSGDSGFSMLYASTPTAAQLAFPIFLGKNAFGSDTDASYVIGPDGERISNPAPIETAKPGTSTLARRIAEGMQYVGLDSIAFPGRIEAAISGVTGGAYSVVNSMLNPSATTIIEGRNRVAASVGKDYYAQPDAYELQTKYRDQLAKYEQEFRRQNGGTTGRDILASPSRDPSANVDDQVRNRVRAIRIGGKDQSQWQQQLSSAKQNGDDVAADAAVVALYEMRLRQNTAYAWGLDKLKGLNRNG